MPKFKIELECYVGAMVNLTIEADDYAHAEKLAKAGAHALSHEEDPPKVIEQAMPGNKEWTIDYDDNKEWCVVGVDAV